MTHEQIIDVAFSYGLNAGEWKSIFGTKFHLKMLRNRLVYTTYREDVLIDGKHIWVSSPRVPQKTSDWLHDNSTGLYFIDDSFEHEIEEVYFYFENRKDRDAFEEKWHETPFDVTV